MKITRIENEKLGKMIWVREQNQGDHFNNIVFHN